MMELYNENEKKAYEAYQRAQLENEIYAIKEYQKAISEIDLDTLDYHILAQLKDWAESLLGHAKTARDLFSKLEDESEYI